MTIIYSFHTGAPLNLWERCCLRSFADHGHEIVLFSYDQLDVPPGVQLSNAGEIVSESDRAAFFAKAPGQFGQFSDLFRYELLRVRGGWWVDTDIVCLSPVLPDEEVVIGLKEPVKSHEPIRVNGAVMRFPAGHPLLEEASAFSRTNLELVGSSWRSVVGPDLTGTQARDRTAGDFAFLSDQRPRGMAVLRPREARRSCRHRLQLSLDPPLAGALSGCRAATR